MNNDVVDQILLKSDTLLNYKGFTGRAEFDAKNKIFTIRILFVLNAPYCTTSNSRDIEDCFRHLVDEYIESCDIEGIDPYPRWAGTFNVRVGTELHSRCVQAAKDRGISLNQLVNEVLEKEVQNYLQSFSS